MVARRCRVLSVESTYTDIKISNDVVTYWSKTAYKMSHHSMLNYIAHHCTIPHNPFIIPSNQICSACAIIHNTCTHDVYIVHYIYIIYTSCHIVCILYIWPVIRYGIRFIYHASSLIYQILHNITVYLSIAYFIFRVMYHIIFQPYIVYHTSCYIYHYSLRSPFIIHYVILHYITLHYTNYSIFYIIY